MLKVGDKVHIGLAVKGGAGYYGVITKIDNDACYVKLNNSNRIVKGPLSKVSKLNEECDKPKSKIKFKKKSKIEIDPAVQEETKPVKDYSIDAINLLRKINKIRHVSSFKTFADLAGRIEKVDTH